MATLGEEMKNLRSELQEHRVNAVEGTTRTVDPNQRRSQNPTRFCNYCRINGHTPSGCRKIIRDEELKRIENERTAEKRVKFTQDYNRKRRPDHGSEQWIRGKDFQRTIQNYNNDGSTRKFPSSYQKFSLQGPTSHKRTITRTTEDHMINAQISQLFKNGGNRSRN